MALSSSTTTANIPASGPDAILQSIEVHEREKFRIAYRKVTPQMLPSGCPRCRHAVRELVPIMEMLRAKMKEKHEAYRGLTI